MVLKKFIETIGGICSWSPVITYVPLLWENPVFVDLIKESNKKERFKFPAPSSPY